VANDRGQRENWNKFIANGENPMGFVAVTPNGNSSDRGPGINHQPTYGEVNINGPRWTMPAPEYPMGVGMPAPVRGKPGSGRTANRNRTAE